MSIFARLFRLQVVNMTVLIVVVNSSILEAKIPSLRPGLPDFTWEWYRDVGTDLIVLIVITYVRGGCWQSTGVASYSRIFIPVHTVLSAFTRFLLPSLWSVVMALGAWCRRRIRGHKIACQYTSLTEMHADFVPPAFYLPERCVRLCRGRVLAEWAT